MADAPGGTVPAATVAEAVLDYINTMTGIPVTCRFGELADKTPALSMQGQSRAKKDREYLSGAYVAVYPFKVIYKSPDDSTASNLAADKLLCDIGAHLEGATFALPTGMTLYRVEMISAPESLGLTEGGQAVHGAEYQITFKQS